MVSNRSTRLIVLLLHAPCSGDGHTPHSRGGWRGRVRTGESGCVLRGGGQGQGDGETRGGVEGMADGSGLGTSATHQ